MYYDPKIIKIDKNINKNIKNILSKNNNISKNQKNKFIYVFLIFSSFQISLIFLAFLILSVSIKYGHEKFKKHLK